jgi:SAM-dependent methyltransferase
VVAERSRHIDARQGYDLWSETYDETPNPVVAMDTRHTLRLLTPTAGERILDAGCGTGRNFETMLRAGSRPAGIDFSLGMLRVARRKYPQIPLLLADLHSLPLREESFDAVLCALVGEHLEDLSAACSEFHRVLRLNGRLVFSVYHPEMAAAGIEANFERSGVTFRLGACRHGLAAYTNGLERVGFTDLVWHELRGDKELADRVPSAHKYLDLPVLLVLEAIKTASHRQQGR